MRLEITLYVIALLILVGGFITFLENLVKKKEEK